MKVTYDAEVAKAYGIPAAILLAKIAYLQRYSPRADGFCWRTAAAFEEETGLSAKQQRHALARLEVAGLVEVKATRAKKRRPTRPAFSAHRRGRQGGRAKVPKGHF